jgi:Caspase domain
MSKHALLIGSPFDGLTGVANDLATMTPLLEKRGFAISQCSGVQATRDGILAAWRRLIATVIDSGAVVVYYSGHGGIAVSAEAEASDPLDPDVKRPWRYQFIVPMDFAETTETDFRGITSPELSRLLRDLTAKTPNVTFILDCCHAARMSRDLDLMPKALPRVHYLGVAGHLDRLRRQSRLQGPTFVEGNPDAVRIVAAGTTESAYEYTNPQGCRIGVLTEALGVVLDAAGDQPVSWRNVMLRVRERVLAVVHQQHPEVEGPATRILFGIDTVDVSGALGIGANGGKPVLRGGRVAGVEKDDVYAVMPFGSETVDPALQIAEATVLHVRGATALVSLSPENAQVPEGALAFPIRKALPRWAVRLEGDGPLLTELQSRLAVSRFIREVDTEEADPVLATARLSGGQVELLDRTGLSLVRPRRPDPQAISDTAANLDILARAQHLLALQGGAGPYALDVPVTIALGRVEAGHMTPLVPSGETLLVGEKVCLTVRNEGRHTVYASVFDIGVTGKVTLLSASSPSGQELPPGGSYLLGEDDYDGTLVGIGLTWPGTAPADAPRRETLVVVLTSAPLDLRNLETGAMQGTARSADDQSGDGSELARILNQISFGGMRDAGPLPAAADIRYGVRHIDFMLDPSSLTVPDLPANADWASTDFGYVFDERPDRSLTRAVPRGIEHIPAAVAVRLVELIVHRNKAIFGSADLRLDCMVVTGVTKWEAPYRVSTARFPSIRDNDRLPMDNLLVFHGPAKDFLDFAVWISRDDSGTPALTELMQQAFNSTEFKTAAATLVGLAALGPQGAAAIAGISASATLVSIGARLIRAGVGKSIGLYRTSLLASEGFATGRHPANGLLRSQDFSFAYEIACVG